MEWSIKQIYLPGGSHNLLINGFTARDVTLTEATDVTDATDPYTTADEDAAPASTIATPNLTDLLNVASTSNSILDASTIVTYGDSFNNPAGDLEAEATTAEATTTEIDAAAPSDTATTANVDGVNTEVEAQGDAEVDDTATLAAGDVSLASADLSPEERTSQLLRDAEGLEEEIGAQVQGHEPLTQIASGLRRANSLLKPTPTPTENEARMVGQSTAMTKHRAQLVDDAPRKPETRKPMVDTVSPLMDYSAPRPSTSFTNISKIDKILDPLDPMAPNYYNLTTSAPSIPLIDSDESKEVRKDAD